MSTLKSNESGSVGGGREYDQEIKDMANYVHNFKVDSDLAVCPRYDEDTHGRSIDENSMRLLATSSSIP